MRFNTLAHDAGADGHRNYQLHEEVQKLRLTTQRIKFDNASRDTDMENIRKENKDSHNESSKRITSLSAEGTSSKRNLRT